MKINTDQIINKLSDEIKAVQSRKEKATNEPKNFTAHYLESKFSKMLFLLPEEQAKNIVDVIVDKYFRKEGRIKIAKGLESYSSLMIKLKNFFNNDLLDQIVQGYDSKNDKSVVTLVIDNAKSCIDTIEQDENNKSILINKDGTRILPSVNFTDLDKRDARQNEKK